jgi:hypothetical protein
MVEEWADAERCYPASDLIEGDDATGDGGRQGGELFLTEADGQRQERGAPEPCEREGENTERGLVLRH